MSEPFIPNPGQIMATGPWPQWITHVGPFELRLDIIPVGHTAAGDEFGIASFVVMEQPQPLLAHLGEHLAATIASTCPEARLLLLTVESKGSHLAPWVWQALAAHRPGQVVERVITLRKGTPKVYMQRPVPGIALPQVACQSITSSQPQSLTISPRDAELLLTESPGSRLVLVDDFIGAGGTVVAVRELVSQLGCPPPDLMAVAGSDGDLYRASLADVGQQVSLLPQPLPLRLPTFRRAGIDAPWQVASSSAAS